MSDAPAVDVTVLLRRWRDGDEDAQAQVYSVLYEELWRQDNLYDLVGVLGWNDAPVERGRGSAIFLHVASPDYGPTEGCVALALGDLQRVLAAGLGELMVLPS